MIQHITKRDFHELVIRNHESLDFVAKCTTPWHLIGLRAFVEKLCSSNKTVRGVLLIRKHNSGKSTNYFISEDELVFPNNASVDVFFEDRASSSTADKGGQLFNIFFRGIDRKRTGHTVYLLQSFYQDYLLGFMFLTRTDSKCELYCIDEGVGSYRNKLDLSHYYFSKGIKKGIQAWANWSLSSYLEKRMHCYQEWFTILKKNDKGWVKNDEVCKWYSQVLRQSPALVFPDNKYIIVLTQPFDTEEDRASAGTMYEALDKEIRYYQERGYKVYIKPHPRETNETINTYKQKGYLIFPFSGGFETILGGLDNLPDCVIGLNTTSLITAQVLFDIKSVSVIRKAQGDFSKGTQKTYDAFYGYFKNIVEF